MPLGLEGGLELGFHEICNRCETAELSILKFERSF